MVLEYPQYNAWCEMLPCYQNEFYKVNFDVYYCEDTPLTSFILNMQKNAAYY